MQNILFLDKVLLGRKPASIRGVEIFNLSLLKDLGSLGYKVTLPHHPDWADAGLPDDIERIPVRGAGRPLLAGLAAVWKLRRRRFDVLLLANTANGLIPSLRLIKRIGIADRCVLIAHREPSPRFLKNLRVLRTRVDSVNGIFADQFRKAGGYERVEVYYGIVDADQFYPGPAGAGNADTTRFCVIGQLDAGWKGADTALAAFRAMPEAVRSRCELHLASYAAPPALQEKNIFAYGWKPFKEMPGLVRSMDVMLVPSRDEEIMRETFSQVMVQGMLSGLPVLASDLPVLREKLDCGGGAVFRNIQELSGLMVRIHEDRALRAKWSAEARKTALDRYVWDTRRFSENFLAGW